MPAGFKYDLKPIEANMPEMCRFETVYRYSGGFNLVLDNLAGVDKIPPMTPLVLDFVKRQATAVINVEVAEKYTSGTTMKIKKNSLAYVGMFIGDGTNGAKINKIDTTNEAYDTLTLAAAFGSSVTVEAGMVLYEATAVAGTEKKALAKALNYAWTKVEPGATVTAIGRAYEIRTTKLIVPISEADKESLGDRFMFTY
ncbi:head fiber protein [uncultured Bacteroides sp.]|uniref:head fiber protein n=1 Tax=uncultured Bacteroides sp. TaxID=162156 RepID=UPI002676938E|nr:head fiber protein [uncultured Bacteroides sp.]